MDIDSTQFILAVVRGILVTIVVFLMTRFYNNYLPKSSSLYRMWENGKKTRIFLTKYYWLVGLLDFVINILILFLLKI